MIEGKYRNLMIKISEDEKANGMRLEEKDRYYEEKIRMKESLIEELKSNLARAQSEKGTNRDLERKVNELTMQLQEKENNLNDLEHKTQKKVAELIQNY